MKTYPATFVVAADALASASRAEHGAQDAGQSHDTLLGVAAVEGLVAPAGVLWQICVSHGRGMTRRFCLGQAEGGGDVRSGRRWWELGLALA